MTQPSFSPVPEFLPDAVEHRRRMARAIGLLLKGKMNVTLDVTLTANSTTTTINDPRIGYYTAIIPAMPMTANAAAEIGAGGLYIEQSTLKTGQAVITHANNTQTDRKIRFLIIG